MASTILIVIPPIANYQGTTILTVSMILFAASYGLGNWMSKLEARDK